MDDTRFYLTRRGASIEQSGPRYSPTPEDLPAGQRTRSAAELPSDGEALRSIQGREAPAPSTPGPARSTRFRTWIVFGFIAIPILTSLYTCVSLWHPDHLRQCTSALGSAGFRQRELPAAWLADGHSLGLPDRPSTLHKWIAHRGVCPVTAPHSSSTTIRTCGVYFGVNSTLRDKCAISAQRNVRDFSAFGPPVRPCSEVPSRRVSAHWNHSSDPGSSPLCRRHS